MNSIRTRSRRLPLPILAALTLSVLIGGAHPDDRPKPLRFILLTPFVDYSFFDPVKKGMADAAQSLGVEAVFSGTPDGDLQALAKKVQEATKAGYDGIALNIFDSAAMEEPVAEAARAGIPLIAFNVDDRRTATARLAAIGQDVRQAGRTFGSAAATFIPQGGHVLLTMHNADISALEERAAGAREALNSKGLFWTSLITSPEIATAVERIRAALKADPSIHVILSTGSADTEAAGKVIEQYFAGRGYICAGFDLSPETLRLVKAGIIRFTVDQQPYAQGYYAVVELALYRRFGIKPSNIDTGAAIISADMVDQIIQLSRQHYR